MRPTVVSAWQRDVLASCLVLNPVSSQTNPKRKRSEEAVQPLNQQSPKQRRIALSPTDNNPRNMSTNTKEHSTGKRARTPSPRKRIHAPPSATVMEVAPAPPQLPLPHFEPPSSYRDALASEYDDTEILQRRSHSRRTQTESDVLSTSKRSASPVKRVAALQDVGGGIFYQELSDNGMELGKGGQELFWMLQDSSLGVAALPAALELELLPELERIRPFQIDNVDPRGREELLVELDTVREINKASRRCVKENESEPEWNNSVHGALLRLALKNSNGAGFRYITTARIDPQYVPAHSSGLAVSSKMVDYVIYLEAGESQSSDSSTAKLLHEKISALATDITQSINHTSYLSLRHRPIAVSIETKTISRPEEEARVQLAIWVAAQVERIRSLMITPESVAVLGGMAFPLLYVQSAQWTALLARPSPSPLDNKSITIFSSIILGETSSLLGTYRVLRGLRILEHWIDTTYRKWWEELLGDMG